MRPDRDAILKELDDRAARRDEVRRVLTGKWPVNVVNRDVKGKNRAGL